MKTTNLPIAHIDVPITRVEDRDDVTVIEGYAYVNATVPGDRYNLTRAALEEATDDYLKWGAIREMHTANAIGRCLSAVWDDKGCKITAEISDDAARKKIERGVLKALSVGAKPMILRGNTVTKVTWVENSLVDRPKDADSTFAVIRSDEAGTEEVSVEVEEETPAEARADDDVKRGAFADAMKTIEPQTLTSRAIDVLSSQLYNALVYENANSDTRAAALDQTLSEFRAYVAPMMERGEMFIEPGAALARAEDLGTLKVELTDEAADAIVSRSADAVLAKFTPEIVRGMFGGVEGEEFIGRRAEVGVRPNPSAAFKPLQRFEDAPGEGEKPVDHAAEIDRLTKLSQATDDMGEKKQFAAEIGRHQRAIDASA